MSEPVITLPAPLGAAVALGVLTAVSAERAYPLGSLVAVAQESSRPGYLQRVGQVDALCRRRLGRSLFDRRNPEGWAALLVSDGLLAQAVIDDCQRRDLYSWRITLSHIHPIHPSRSGREGASHRGRPHPARPDQSLPGGRKALAT